MRQPAPRPAARFGLLTLASQPPCSRTRRLLVWRTFVARFYTAANVLCPEIVRSIRRGRSHGCNMCTGLINARVLVLSAVLFARRSPILYWAVTPICWPKVFRVLADLPVAEVSVRLYPCLTTSAENHAWINSVTSVVLITHPRFD